jgi:hypothetical protein
MQQGREALGAAGWQIEYPEDFRHHVLEVEGWEADLVESEGGWFDLDMGIIVEGERLALAPLLATLFRHDGRWLEGALLAQIADDEPVELQTPRRQRIRVPASRIKPLAATLIDLFDNFTGGSTLRVWPNSTTPAAGSSRASTTSWRSPTSCARRKASPASSRQPGCASNCAPTRRKVSPGCSSCAATTSPASSPTTWASARRRRHWPTCCSKRRPAASTSRR